MADVSVPDGAGPRGPRGNTARDREITLNGSEHSTTVQPNAPIVVVPTVTDEDLHFVHLWLRKVATPAAPVVVWRVDERLQ